MLSKERSFASLRVTVDSNVGTASGSKSGSVSQQMSPPPAFMYYQQFTQGPALRHFLYGSLPNCELAAHEGRAD
jgi:hypothetical protein